MKLNKTLLVVTGTAALTAGLIGLVNSPLLQSEPISCVKVLMDKASETSRKAVMPNQDGGYFLLTEGNKPNRVQVDGFLGPRSAQTLADVMRDNGLLNVRISVQGTCETDGGVVYTLISGHYDTPEQKPDPI